MKSNQKIEIILAGFGGQGILFAGKVLAYSGLMGDHEVTWMPSYGPEMRGGTANCHVTISDYQIGSPIIMNPNILLIMNNPSLDKFEGDVETGGTVIIDSTLVSRKINRDDVNAVYIPATEIATEMKIVKSANIIALGKLVKETGIFEAGHIKVGIEKSIQDHKKNLYELNMKAFQAGYEY